MSTIVQTFYAAPGSHLKNRDADMIGQFIVNECDGALSAVEFVQRAQSVSSPLHPYLEWDDQLAAHQYRLEQARVILRSICVYDESAPDEKVRAFHQVVVIDDGQPRSTYMSHQVVWRQPDLVQQVVEQAYRELRAFTKKYRTYKELSPVVSAIEEVIELEL